MIGVQDDHRCLLVETASAAGPATPAIGIGSVASAAAANAAVGVRLCPPFWNQSLLSLGFLLRKGSSRMGPQPSPEICNIAG